MSVAVYTDSMAAASVSSSSNPSARRVPGRTWRTLLERLLGALIVVAGLTAAPSVQAQEPAAIEGEQEQAANLFAAAEAAFSEQDYERAARLFERANDKAPHASAAYNAAVSYDYAKKRARAADAYQLALTLANLEPAQGAQAEQRLAELGLQLGYVHIAKPVGGLATVGRIERQPIPLRFYQEPGAYTIELETPEGEKTSTQIVVVGGQTLRVELNPIQRTSLPPDTKSLERTSMPPPPSSPAPVTAEPNSTQEVLGWVGIGIGVAAAGVAAYLGYQVWRNQDAYLESGRTDLQRYNDHETLRARTNAAWATSGLTGALGATLLLTSPTFEF